MPIGGGIIPATGSTQYTELTYVTRRAFIPKPQGSGPQTLRAASTVSPSQSANTNSSRSSTAS